MSRVSLEDIPQVQERIDTVVLAGVTNLDSVATRELRVGVGAFPMDWSYESRFRNRYLTIDPVPAYLLCPKTFTWWSVPYEHQHCSEDPEA